MGVRGIQRRAQRGQNNGQFDRPVCFTDGHSETSMNATMAYMQNNLGTFCEIFHSNWRFANIKGLTVTFFRCRYSMSPCLSVHTYLSTQSRWQNAWSVVPWNVWNVWNAWNACHEWIELRQSLEQSLQVAGEHSSPKNAVKLINAYKSFGGKICYWNAPELWRLALMRIKQTFCNLVLMWEICGHWYDKLVGTDVDAFDVTCFWLRHVSWTCRISIVSESYGSARETACLWW